MELCAIITRAIFSIVKNTFSFFMMGSISLLLRQVSRQGSCSLRFSYVNMYGALRSKEDEAWQWVCGIRQQSYVLLDTLAHAAAAAIQFCPPTMRALWSLPYPLASVGTPTSWRFPAKVRLNRRQDDGWASHCEAPLPPQLKRRTLKQQDPPLASFAENAFNQTSFRMGPTQQLSSLSVLVALASTQSPSCKS